MGEQNAVSCVDFFVCLFCFCAMLLHLEVRMKNEDLKMMIVWDL